MPLLSKLAGADGTDPIKPKLARLKLSHQIVGQSRGAGHRRRKWGVSGDLWRSCGAMVDGGGRRIGRLFLGEFFFPLFFFVGLFPFGVVFVDVFFLSFVFF